MANITVQNHFTIRRLRTGDTLFLTIEGNGVPLIQTVNASTGIPTPDWTTEANQPVLTPKVNAASGNPVALSAHKWMYNGSELTFTGTTTDGWTIDSSERFKINRTTGALRIVGNLGGADNLDSDVLQYSCAATAGEIDYPMTRSIDIQILGSGVASYYGMITATTEQITANTPTATVTTRLFFGSEEKTGYTVKWYKDEDIWTEKGNGSSIIVNRGDVDGAQLIIAEFYESAEDISPVFRAGIRIIDTLDDYFVAHRYVVSATNRTTTGANTEVAPNKPVYLEAYVVNVRTNVELTWITDAKWVSNIMDKDTWTSLLRVPVTGENTGATNLVMITTAQTDKDNVEKDVVVVSEVEWSL